MFKSSEAVKGTLFRIVITLVGTYTHGERDGKTNPKVQCDLTLIRPGIVTKSGNLSADIKAVKEYLRSEFGDTVYRLKNIDRVA